jgi:hypothetical protein
VTFILLCTICYLDYVHCNIPFYVIFDSKYLQVTQIISTERLTNLLTEYNIIQSYLLEPEHIRQIVNSKPNLTLEDGILLVDSLHEDLLYEKNRPEYWIIEKIRKLDSYACTLYRDHPYLANIIGTTVTVTLALGAYNFVPVPCIIKDVLEHYNIISHDFVPYIPDIINQQNLNCHVIQQVHVGLLLIGGHLSQILDHIDTNVIPLEVKVQLAQHYAQIGEHFAFIIQLANGVVDNEGNPINPNT